MKLRKIIQILFFVLILLTSIGHGLEESGVSIPLISSASLHAVCPFGGVVSIYEYFVSGSYVKKVHESSFILMFIVFGLAIVLGPVFCGWICPFGTFQEWVSKIGRKVFKKRFNTFIPYKVDKYLRFIRYFILILVLVKTAQSVELLFANIDPYYALFNIWSDEVAITAYIALLVVVILSLFVERPFCKYACPYGALLGITNLFRPAKIKREASTCISCSVCDKKCPMNIPLSNIDVSKDHQCISCMECTSEANCPKADTMTFSIGKRVLSYKNVAIITVSLFIIGIGGSMALNLWKTESSKIPVKFSSGEFEGINNPADIRGSYTLEDVKNAFDVPVDDIVRAFALLDIKNPESFMIKELEGRYIFEDDIEIGTDAVRLFVALYRGLPYTPEEDTVLLRPANSVLKDIISSDKKEYLNSILVDLPIMTNDSLIEHQDESTDIFEIKGKTTFKEVIDQGVSEDDLIKIIGSIPDNLNMTIRDYSIEIQKEFSLIKSELEGYL
ncbi:4Fe-4S binding protein [Thiospirochaeta perfilievii]|uniref:4Fe-4S binding protein n=1 Tax=Thiospirochaeta perfilievii TaxID=252967 RepID=A0A5C1QAB9_9SPIO|nr:4Fe-4S binding protein [Thiospirochaeta perfilievii]QEN05083.1 4Fe-4S binding protein [Thiospirochaeta perfilievii]